MLDGFCTNCTHMKALICRKDLILTTPVQSASIPWPGPDGGVEGITRAVRTCTVTVTVQGIGGRQLT